VRKVWRQQRGNQQP